jgi:hypothetical protein
MIVMIRRKCIQRIYIEERRIMRLKIENRNYLIPRISVDNIVESFTYVTACFHNGVWTKMIKNEIDQLYWYCM